MAWSSKLRDEYIASNDVDDFVSVYDESANISIVEKLAAQYKKLVELADGIAITNASIASFVDLGSRLRDLLSSFSLNPFLPQRRSATPNRQSATPNKRRRQDDDNAEEGYGNDNENDGDTGDDDDTNQHSPVPPVPPPRPAQPTVTLYDRIQKRQNSAAGIVTTANPLKDADIGKLVSIMYEKKSFQSSMDRRSIADIWMPEMVSKNDSNKQYYVSTMNYLSFHISQEESKI